MIPALLILCDTVQQAVTNTPTFWDTISSNPIYIILSILGALASIIAFIFAVIRLIKKFTRAHNWRRKYINSNILDNVLYQYLPEDNTSKTKKNKDDNIQTNSSYKDNIDSNIYIQPYIKTPDKNPTPFFQLKTPERLKDFFIDKVFVRRRDIDIPNHYYLLGDSGSGKTNALVRLFYDYLHHYKHDYTNQEKKDCLPYNIRIFSLRVENVFESINKVNVDKKGCILLLDALDENPMAQKPKESEEYKSFIQQLEKVYTDFAFVITTCRSQFFSVEKEIPDTHNIAKIELVPFNDDQIDEFLSEIFNISNEAELRSKAIELIKKKEHHEIAKRPIILTYIRDLVNTDRELNTSLDFYDTIAESELCRNINRIQHNVTAEQIRQWWDMTSEVAGYMYQHGKTEISYEELRDFLIQHGIDHPDKYINEDHFQRRSLLTRSSIGFHFSHKSFYEYFMAYRFLQHPEEIKQVYGMDFALLLYDELCDAYSNHRKVSFADLHTIDNNVFAKSLLNIGNSLYKIKHFTQAKPKYTKALNISRKLAENNPDAFLPDVAMTLNNLANLHSDTHNYPQAEQEYAEALEIRRQLANGNPDAFLPHVADTLNNLGSLLFCTNKYPLSEQRYSEALKIRRQLAETDPETFLPRVADTLNNLGLLHSNTHNYPQAEQEYFESLNSFRQLAKTNPNVFLSRMAITLNNLGILHRNTKNYPQSEQEYSEALEIRLQLAKVNRDTFLPDVAITLNNLGKLHYYTHKYPQAEEEYTKALSIRRQLAEANPDAFLSDVAGTLFNIACLHLARKEYPAAEAAALESLEKYRIMAEKSSAAFEPKVKRGEELLENIRKAKETDE